MNFLKTVCFMLLALSGVIEGADYARKAAAFLGKAFYWGGSFGLPIGRVLGEAIFEEELNSGKHDEKVPFFYDLEVKYGLCDDRLSRDGVPTYSRAKSLISQELASLGLPADTRVIVHDEFGAFKDWVLVGCEDLWAAEKALARMEATDRSGQGHKGDDINVINRLKGLLHHEANHILHGDTTWRGTALACASACIPAGLRAAYRAARPVVDQVKRCVNLRKVLSGQLNGIASKQIDNAGSRTMEQQADDRVQDVEAIKGLISFLERINAEINRAYENKPVALWIKNNISTHPSVDSRIAKLKSRLVERE